MELIRPEKFFVLLITVIIIAIIATGTVGILADTIGCPPPVTYDHCPPPVTYDHNHDGVVDIVDMSIAIDTLQRTVEAAKNNY